jgi:hypothetical protein
MNASTLPALLQRFFTDRLTAQLQASPNTIAGYRDTFRLLLRYASQRRNRPPTKLRIDDIDAALIGDFLTHVEKVRRNSARSNGSFQGVRIAEREARKSARPASLDGDGPAPKWRGSNGHRAVART